MDVLEAQAPWPGPLPRSIFYFLLTSLGGTLVMLPLALVGAGGARAVARGVRAQTPRALQAFAISLASYSLVLEALREAQASYVVAVRQASVLFAVGLGIVGLGERPGPARIGGAGVIAAGVALLAWAR